MSDCTKCYHNQVCGHQNQWKEYCEEHIKLREKSVLFDADPICRYYVDKDMVEIKHIHKINNSNELVNNQVDDMKTKAYKSLIKDSKGRDKYFKENAKEEKEPLDKSKIFYYETPNDCNFINEDKCCKTRKLTEEDFIKVLEKLLNI